MKLIPGYIAPPAHFFPINIVGLLTSWQCIPPSSYSVSSVIITGPIMITSGVPWSIQVSRHFQTLTKEGIRNGQFPQTRCARIVITNNIQELRSSTIISFFLDLFQKKNKDISTHFDVSVTQFTVPQTLRYVPLMITVNRALVPALCVSKHIKQLLRSYGYVSYCNGRD